jgi:hypothetical protein
MQVASAAKKPWLKLKPRNATHTARRSAAHAATRLSGNFSYKMPDFISPFGRADSRNIFLKMHG